MWKVLISILAISDTGAVTTSNQLVELQSEQLCRQAEQGTGTSVQEALGHRIQQNITVQCFFDGPDAPAAVASLPPVEYQPRYNGPPMTPDGRLMPYPPAYRSRSYYR
jgi:hypothetical protein